MSAILLLPTSDDDQNLFLGVLESTSQAWLSGVMYILAMRTSLIAALFLPLTSFHALRAQDVTVEIRKAVERATLDQSGTKPFHLKATLEPSFERDKNSGRTGEVEIWWQNPDTWRRDVQAPEFHQIEIVSGGKIWQKNEGNYFPEWLRETAVALVKPVPYLDKTLNYARTGEQRKMPGETTHVSWVEMGSDGPVSKGIGAGISLSARGISFASGIGYSAGLGEFTDFHGRSVARKVTSGGFGPEITAHVTLLEDLRDTPPALFNTDANPSDLIETRVLEELAERKNLLPQEVVGWPPVEQGPLEGILLAKVVVDREGKVREIGSIVSDNPGLNGAAEERMRSMRFKPYLEDGIPVQVVTTITMPFKTTRPAGVESFESARTYFEHGRQTSYLAADPHKPYVLHAEFKTRGSSGEVVTGFYTDTWLSDTQWRREASVGKSRVVRTRNGDKRYLLAEGSDAPLLRLVVTDMEPIPAIDTFVESDWRIKRDTVAGVPAIRVARGYENPDGTPDPKQFNAYWFDDSGRLLKTFSNGLETRLQNFQSFDGVGVARRIDVLNNGKLALQLSVTGLEPAGAVPSGDFVLKGHEWVRQFTAEVR